MNRFQKYLDRRRKIQQMPSQKAVILDLLEQYETIYKVHKHVGIDYSTVRLEAERYGIDIYIDPATIETSILKMGYKDARSFFIQNSKKSIRSLAEMINVDEHYLMRLRKKVFKISSLTDLVE